MALNYTIVNGVLGLSFVSAFIMAFSSFFFASLVRSNIVHVVIINLDILCHLLVE